MNEFDKHAALSLQQLGRKVPYPQSPEEALLEVIPHIWKGSDFCVHIVCEEFTCVCPLTGQPDYAKIFIEYRPQDHLIESKSLKLYLGSFRNVGIFHESVINKICHDLATILKPLSIEVKGEFAARGGIRITPKAKWTSS
jgi:7-cyano-7-deazaguanine reductase